MSVRNCNKVNYIFIFNIIYGVFSHFMFFVMFFVMFFSACFQLKMSVSG
jgi:hypothetical protein